MGLFGHNGVKTLIAVILVLCGLWLITANTGNNLFASVVNTVSYPLRKLGWAAEKTADNGKTIDELQDENKELINEISSLREKLSDYYDVKRENEQLRKYYNIKAENSNYNLIPASVINRDPNNIYHSFIADIGSTSGVKVNDPVLTEKGLVGWVSQVDISSCTVTTILSDATKMSAVDKKTSDIGVLNGKSSLWRSNQTAFTLLDETSEVQKGDIITTSGMGGIFPPGLLIGTVKEVLYDEYDTSKFAVVSAYENIKNVSEIVILTDYTDRG